MPYLTAHSCRYFIYMAKLIRRILTVGGNFKMPRDNNYHFEDGELDSFLKKSLKYWKSSGNGQLVMKNLKESELDIFPPLADYTERVCFPYTKQCELIYFLGHIRNSLAHGRFNVVGTKKDPIIIMEDRNSSGNCSARMILHLSTMNKWITLFESRFGIDNNKI